MAEPGGQAGRRRLTRDLRVRRRRDFERVFAVAVRFGDSRLTVWGLANETGYTRLGLVVGRRHGNAVRRNRLKRVLREAFRLSRPELPVGLDLVCSPRVGADLRLESCRRSLAHLAERIAQRIHTKPERTRRGTGADGNA
ncbi:MAG: ribonuclease P protein component [Phycisphaerae bacterium]|jgi:ribonuclease P protein component